MSGTHFPLVARFVVAYLHWLVIDVKFVLDSA